MAKYIVLVLVIFSVIGCSTSAPLYNVNGERVPTLVDGQKPTESDVEKAILFAATKRGWSPRVISPGVIDARITVRTHKAIVRIDYTSESYSITYKDSSNLEYKSKKEKIHRNYNKWVQMLSGSIQRELGVRTQVY
jgi:hypothetical protein